MTAAHSEPLESAEIGNILAQRVARNVRAEMARAGMSQTDTGALLHLSQQAVSTRLRGVTPFTLNQIGALANRFGMTAGDLVDGGGRGPVTTSG